MLSHWFSVRLLMPIPLWWESPRLVSQVAQHVLCDQVFFSMRKPSRVFQAQCKSRRSWRISHCFMDKSLGLILVPQKVTNPVWLCAKGGAKLLFCLVFDVLKFLKGFGKIRLSFHLRAFVRTYFKICYCQLSKYPLSLWVSFWFV